MIYKSRLLYVYDCIVLEISLKILFFIYLFLGSNLNHLKNYITLYYKYRLPGYHRKQPLRGLPDTTRLHILENHFGSIGLGHIG